MKISALQLCGTAILLLAVPLAANSQPPPEAKRFVIKGLRVGDPPSSIKQFLASNNLQPSEEPKMDYVQGTKSVRKIEYVNEQSYSNRKSGVEEVSVTLYFTPPYQTTEGAGSSVWMIIYITHYGEGVSVQNVKADLLSRYGQATSAGKVAPQHNESDYLIWTPSIDLDVQAHIDPSFDAGEPGKLVLKIACGAVLQNARDKAKAYVDRLDSQRPKDTTKPDL